LHELLLSCSEIGLQINQTYFRTLHYRRKGENANVQNVQNMQNQEIGYTPTVSQELHEIRVNGF